MATQSVRKIDFAALQESLQSQFRGLDPNDPASWPALPRYGMCLALTVLIVVGLWFAWLQGVDEQLKTEQDKEQTLRADYRKRLEQAVNLDALLKQREEVQQYVNQLEKQLPSKAEMDALLSDINQAGIGRSLQFEEFRPGNVLVKEYYAELPIALKLSGRYHDMGAFASDIAHLSRIVTLNNIAISPAKDGALMLDAMAKTFRYLDKDEVSAQMAAAKPGAKK